MARNVAHGQEGMYPLERVLSLWRGIRAARHISRDDIVCDAGCGYYGKFLLNHKNKFRKGFGFDVAVNDNLNDEKIVLGAAVLDKGIPLENESVNCVISLAVLEHLDNPGKYISEVFRILKPEGNLVLTTPTPKNKPILEFLAFRARLLHEIEIHDHKNYYTASELRRILIGAGFDNANIIATTWQLGLNNFVLAKK